MKNSITIIIIIIMYSLQFNLSLYACKLHLTSIYRCHRGAGDNTAPAPRGAVYEKNSFMSANHFLLIFEANLKVINA